MPTPSILISGAGVAGPTLAHWLNAAGWNTTVVERFDGLRETTTTATSPKPPVTTPAGH